MSSKSANDVFYDTPVEDLVSEIRLTRETFPYVTGLDDETVTFSFSTTDDFPAALRKLADGIEERIRVDLVDHECQGDMDEFQRRIAEGAA